jgi:hypothetical protein
LRQRLAQTHRIQTPKQTLASAAFSI